ncbi:hypothetical protein LSAT2_016335 [Lamellibrachia satsuma]|nr:hypothetical protein LSAT2_016335 [Lamellibrachia satsuma]
MMWALYYVGTPRLASSVQQVAGQNGHARQTTDCSGHTRGVSDVDIDQQRQRTEAPRSAPFVPGLPRSVLVLAYQRSGSTFVGQVFNTDRRSFYVFEPLDGLYSSVYGTRPGWNIPSDISSFINGSERVVPRWEAAIVSEMLKNVFSCHVRRLATEVLAHKFWSQFAGTQTSVKSFTQCLQRSGANLTICTDIIRGHCPERFGANWTQMAECRRGLSSVSVGRLDQVGGYRSRRLKLATAVTARRASDNVERANATRPTRLVRAARQMPRKETTTRVLANDKNRRGKGKSEQEKRHPRGAPSVQGLGIRKTAPQQQRGGEFRRYSQCIARQAAVVSPCTSHLEAACQSSDLRVVKTVRAAMSETDELFRTLPNFRLVHLIRDPAWRRQLPSRLHEFPRHRLRI